MSAAVQECRCEGQVLSQQKSGQNLKECVGRVCGVGVSVNRGESSPVPSTCIEKIISQ